MASATASKDLSSRLSSLQVNTSSKAKPKSAPVADSWEDEELEEATPTDHQSSDGPSTETSEATSPTGLSRFSTSFDPNPPPPTPASPTNHTFSYSSLEQPSSRPASSRRDAPDSDRRPDKTTATASRLIAAGLGLRPQKRTEEEREYDRTMRDNARKAREKEKEEEQRRLREAEKAKAAVWEE